MRPRASWTAKTAMLTVGFAVAAGGLSGVALGGTAARHRVRLPKQGPGSADGLPERVELRMCGLGV